MTSGFAMSILVVFLSMKSLYTQYHKIFSYLKKNNGGVYFIQYVRNTGRAFIRGEVFIRRNMVGLIITAAKTESHDKTLLVLNNMVNKWHIILLLNK